MMKSHTSKKSFTQAKFNHAKLLASSLVLVGSIAFAYTAFASGAAVFKGIPFQQALTSLQLRQLTAQDDEESDRESVGQIKISWYQSFQDNSHLAQISHDEAVTLGNQAGLGKVYQAKLDEDEGYLVWQLGILGNQGHWFKLTLDAGNGNAMKLDVEAQRDHEDEE